MKPVTGHYYDRIMDLCSSTIIKDPMGSDKRLYDIFGLTPIDLMKMDFDSFIDLERRVTQMRIENEKELIERVKHLKTQEKGT